MSLILGVTIVSFCLIVMVVTTIAVVTIHNFYG